MCGIFALHGSQKHRLPKADLLKHRGPDGISCKHVGNTYLEFNRLAINGGPGPKPPIEHDQRFLIANAEIYNHLELGGVEGDSDCQVILPTIKEYGLAHACELFSGDFAFVLTDGSHVWAARDRIGVRPLFYTRPSVGTISFASEMKALSHFGTEIKAFPPGHVYDGELDAFVCWAPNYWDCPRDDADKEHVTHHIRSLLFQAVDRRVSNTERPVGFFLSGGLDSSIVAALGKKALGPNTRIRTFSIGLKDSPDLLAARDMAAHLDSDHTEVTFTEKEGIEALRDVIWHLESYDTTTVRASVPMYLLSKYIAANTDVRVILSGEGADELFGGYLYFHDAPNELQFRHETTRLVRDVHMFDVLRADRCTAAHGLEVRVPFFDRDVVDYAMDGFRARLKMPRDGFEKALLRDAFQDMLPRHIAWRQKNGMSDAVGYTWVDALRKTGENYQKTFRALFGRHASTVPYKWMPRWSTATDPSARTLSHFNDGAAPPSAPDQELIIKQQLLKQLEYYEDRARATRVKLEQYPN